MDTIGAIFRALGEALGLIKQRGAQLNTPEMVAAKTEQNRANNESQINETLEKKDIDAIRKLDAE